MFKKRGLSAVVTTLIIILLTLVAIGVIWTVINGIIGRGSEEIELGQYTLDLQIKAAQVQNGNITVVVVRRNPGQGDFIGMNFVFSNGTDSEIIRENISLKELEEKSFTFSLTKISTSSLKTISVAPIFEMESGEESVGDVSDMFDIKKGGSVAGTGSSSAGGKFEELGFVGAGKKEYTVSANAGIYPEFKKVIVNPVDVRVGDNQTFTAEVYSPNGIKSVTTTTQLDTQVLNLPLQKISESNGIETWSVTWQVFDTHIEIYRTTFTATDNAGNQNNVTLTWTDACTDQFANGGTSNILVDCTVTSLDGADTSNIVIADGTTLTLSSGAVLAYTPGNSVSKSGSGKILFSGGSLTKQYLFYYDSDADNYTLNSTYVLGTSPSLSGFTRAKDAVNTSDCNESSSAVSITRTKYNDSDADNNTVNLGSFCASSSTWGNSACTTSGSNQSKDNSGACFLINALNGTDCYDVNASAKPGQTSYFTVKRGSVNDSAGNNWDSFDYNCDSASTQSNIDSGVDICDAGTCADGGKWRASVPACGNIGNLLLDPGSCNGNRCFTQTETQSCR